MVTNYNTRLTYKQPLLKTVAVKRDIWKAHNTIKSAWLKHVRIRNQIKFLETCLKQELMPRFLSFRIPRNNKYEVNEIMKMQKQALRRELENASKNLRNQSAALKELIDSTSDKMKLNDNPILRRSIMHSILTVVIEENRIIANRHRKKIERLAFRKGIGVHDIESTIKTIRIKHMMQEHLEACKVSA